MYEAAPEAELLATDLIPKYHSRLIDARITYLYTEKVLKHGGKVIFGKAQKAAELVQFFGETDFVLVFSKPTWSKLTDEQRTALVDHELCHCDQTVTKSGEIKWRVRAHDVEEFTEIISRYGMWHQGLRKFGEAIPKQVEMFGDGGDLAVATVSLAGNVISLEGGVPGGEAGHEDISEGTEGTEGTEEAAVREPGEDAPGAGPGGGARPEDPPF